MKKLSVNKIQKLIQEKKKFYSNSNNYKDQCFEEAYIELQKEIASFVTEKKNEGKQQ